MKISDKQATEADIKLMDTTDLMALLFGGGLLKSVEQSLVEAGYTMLPAEPAMKLIEQAQKEAQQIGLWIATELNRRIPVPR